MNKILTIISLAEAAEPFVAEFFKDEPGMSKDVQDLVGSLAPEAVKDVMDFLSKVNDLVAHAKGIRAALPQAS